MPSTTFDKATDMTPDIRRARAQRMVALTMEVLNRHLDGADARYVVAELLNAYMTVGVEVISDYDRELFGLPPRGEKGWTVEELQAMDDKRLEVLRRPLLPMIVGKFIKPDNQG